MLVLKKIVGTLSKCYSLAPLEYKEQQHFLVAAEQRDRCLLYDGDGMLVDTIWQQPGGTMSMCQVPGRDGVFLAVHQFYSPDDSKDAKIVYVIPDKKGVWNIRTLADLPHIHRIDIIERNKVQYLIACTLKSGHDYTDDWSKPGKVYAAVLPENLEDYNVNQQLVFKVIKDGLLKNHGYTRAEEKGVPLAVISCQSGVYSFLPPESAEKQWKITQLLETAASDAVLTDLNGDGEQEMAVISPFHGNTISIYEKGGRGYQKVYEYEKKAPFAHSIFGGTLCDKPRVVIGHREGERSLICFSWSEKRGYHWTILDRGKGSANVIKIRRGTEDIIISTNRESDEIAMYVCY